MFSSLTTIVAVSLVLGLIVFIHELGHFLAAKAFRVRVNTFSLGFGKRLIGFRRGDTDYRLSLLPLGGYVKMAGESPEDSRTGAPDEFMSKPRWQRFIIALAGPAMNIGLAIGLLVPVYMYRFPKNSYLDQAAVVAAVQPDSPAAQAGIQPHDTILSFDGVQHPTWEQLMLRADISADHAVAVEVQRGQEVVRTRLTPRSNGPDAEPSLGMIPVETTQVDLVAPGSPAERAGVKPGDSLVAVNGQPVLRTEDLLHSLQETAGHPVTLRVQRGAQQQDLSVTPVRMNVPGQPEAWMIGVQLRPLVEFVHLSFGQAVHQSLLQNREGSLLILDLLGKLVSHKASLNTLQGPISIVRLTSQAASQPTISPLLWVTSVISLNLGIMNLLPIPILDGGMIVFLLIEGILRRDISLRIKERVYQAGFAFLIVLMTFVFYNDIVNSFLRHGKG